MDINRTYSVLILRGTQVRRFAISRSGIRCLLWATLFVLASTGAYLTDYIALQRRQLHEVIARAQAQRATVSSLQSRTSELQELVSEWKTVRESIQASLPSRFRASVHDGDEGEELHEILVALHRELKQMISSFPTDWPVQGRIVSGFGMRASPWTGAPEFHAGLDIPNPIGTPVHASGDAVVDSVGNRGGKGQTITLDHGQQITTEYAHLSKILVEEGERVNRGQRIGLVGNTGKSTGPHLHYEVRIKGIPVDPRKGILRSEPRRTNPGE